jgi:hypothetical protein
MRLWMSYVMNKYNFLFWLVFFLFCVDAQASQDLNEAASDHDKTLESHSSIMPKYGNWCGPDYPKNIDGAPNPIDMLDRACQEHDLCYANKGYMSCVCDSEFNEKIVLGLKANRFKGPEKFFAHSFRTYFRTSPCQGNHKDKIAPSRAVHGIVKKIGAKTTDLIDRIQAISSEYGFAEN